jgi:hypothetical protein
MVLMKKMAADKIPRVGIFWVDLNNRKLALIFSEPLHLLQLPPGEEYISGEYGHYDLWERTKRQGGLPGEWRDLEYEYVPRGRVIYDVGKRSYRVYAAGNLVGRKWFQDRVISEFYLPRQQTEFTGDRHYGPPALTIP